MDNNLNTQLESQLADKTDLLTLFERRYNEEHQRALQHELNSIKLERTVKHLSSQLQTLTAATALTATPAPSAPTPTA